MKVLIYDTNNYARIKAETTWGKSWIRELCDEACRVDGCFRIYVFDGKYGNQYRKKFYPEYKATRKPPLIDTFFENLDFFRELLKYAPNNVVTVMMNSFEADDVIADIAKKFKDVTVLTTDKDLTAIPNAVLPMINEKWEDKKYVQARKIFVGDPSDNYKGVDGFGESSWKKLDKKAKDDIVDFLKNPNVNTRDNLAGQITILCGTRAGNAFMNTSIARFEMLKKLVEFRNDVPEIVFSWGVNDIMKMNEKLKEYFL